MHFELHPVGMFACKTNPLEAYEVLIGSLPGIRKFIYTDVSLLGYVPVF